MKTRAKNLTERNAEIWKAAGMGKSLRVIGREFGISHERVRQILDRNYKKTRKALSTPPPENA